MPELTTPVVEPGRFRHVLGHYCSGVTIIAAIAGDEPVGFACQSFQSVSLDPPLVSFAPSRTSTTWPRIRSAGKFTANILDVRQDDLCQAFSISGSDKFDGVSWRPGLTGSPVLDGVLAWVDCEIEREVDAGDHTIVFGRVLDLGASSDGAPLLFYKGKYGHLAQ
ncbi:flavin reductase family protein [Nocardia sp. NBC_00508]|uniref:flavin reductase family protein n=1 Tax=Nocardia sp. NBC_00508 TaxID=2975992 RepID=UPI002E7FC5F5|nr:flavin reductase family protein [Nocardia sp. NBC_00508]WUD67113.1 flavin reductase family protein [Nocardia sp. NBC_00508]